MYDDIVEQLRFVKSVKKQKMQKRVHRVSILIPCYNGSSFIQRCFDSILNQTESNLEVIFVDDGSVDNSIKIADSYVNTFGAKGHKLRIFSKENGGAASAIKVALEYSTGKYIFPLDIDDELLLDSCRLQADFLDSHSDCSVVLTDGYRVFDNGQSSSLIRTKDVISDNIFEGLLAGLVTNIPGMYMINGQFLREYYHSHEFLITQFGQNLQLLMPPTIGNKTGYINLPLLNYHIHKGSHSNPGYYEKDVHNLNGYYEVRLSMLKIMGLEDISYFKLARMAFLTASLIVDAKYRMKRAYNQHYQELRLHRKPSFQEKMEYHILNNTPYQYLYRLISQFKIRQKNV